MTLAGVSFLLSEFGLDHDFNPKVFAETLLSKIDQLDFKLKSFLAINQSFLKDVEVVSQNFVANRRRSNPLLGVSFAVKDLIDTKGIVTTYGSPIFANNIPIIDAVVVKNLKRRGAIVLGKTNTSEFASDITVAPTTNPWDQSRIPGGSSGGSAVAVAANLAPFAIGTDTGGSVRIPAAMCGVTGLMPSFRKLSTKGVMHSSWTLDNVGPICRFASDLPSLLEGMGYLLPQTRIKNRHRKMRVGLISDFLEKSTNPVKSVVQAAVNKLESEKFVEIVEFTNPDQRGVKPAIEACDTIGYCEIAVCHEELYSKYGDRYGSSARELVKKGKEKRAFEYIYAMNYRKKITRLFDKEMSGLDLLVMPALPNIAPSIQDASKFTENNLAPYLEFMELFNLLGYPALVAPCGFVDGLPVGIQFATNRGNDGILVELATKYQKVTEWHQRVSQITAVAS